MVDSPADFPFASCLVSLPSGGRHTLNRMRNLIPDADGEYYVYRPCTKDHNFNRVAPIGVICGVPIFELREESSLSDRVEI